MEKGSAGLEGTSQFSVTVNLSKPGHLSGPSYGQGWNGGGDQLIMTHSVETPPLDDELSPTLPPLSAFKMEKPNGWLRHTWKGRFKNFILWGK